MFIGAGPNPHTSPQTRLSLQAGMFSVVIDCLLQPDVRAVNVTVVNVTGVVDRSIPICCVRLAASLKSSAVGCLVEVESRAVICPHVFSEKTCMYAAPPAA